MGKGGVARWILWAVTLGLLCALALWRMDPAGPVETNILTLLPDQHDSAALDKATERSRDAFSQQLLALVTGPDEARTRQAAVAARGTLLGAGLVASDTGDKVDQALALFDRHAFALLTPAQRRRFEHEGPKALATDVAVTLASPAGLVDLDKDPGGYAGRFMAELPRPYPDFMPDGPMLSAGRDGGRVFLLRLSAGPAAFGSADSERAAQAVAAAAKAVTAACAECRFEATGAALFADAARKEAKQETTWLTLTSMLLIMLLIAFVFRSLAPHLLGFLQLFSSVAAASAAVIAVFGTINILTLVFGTTLLGIAIDYAFLYFSEYWFGRSAPAAVMRKIRAGLGVGLATGVLAFAFLALTGFAALTQIALFSVAGLLEAALVVVLIFPVTLTRPPAVADHAAVHWPARFVARACRATHWRYLLPLLALLLAAPGWFWLKSSDDVRELSHFPPALMQVDGHIRATLARFPASGFFLIDASDLDQALARENDLFGRLDGHQGISPLGLSRFLPSVQSQQASLAAWQGVMADPAALRRTFVDMGLPAELADHVERGWQTADKTPMTPKQLFAAVPDLERFVIPHEGGVALIATVFGDHEVGGAALSTAADGLSGVRFIEPLKRMSDTFAGVRVRAIWLVVIGYLLISGLLVWRYGVREGLRMLYPPLLAMGITLGAMGWLGEPVNVFVVVALILILGLGRDYAVFLREVGARAHSPALAVTLSAITTLLSFGLLALSRIPALHVFGLATGIGILASYLLAPLSLPPIRDEDRP